VREELPDDDGIVQRGDQAQPAPAMGTRQNINDMSEVNVDAQLMKNGSALLSRVDERLVEMQNG
jgi:hypothetical protein